jgi:hypothetical protein
MPYYDFKPGRYQIMATVNIIEWGQEISSPPKVIEIIRGTTIWEQVVGVPTEEGPPEPRKYALQQARYLTDLLMYLRLTDVNESHVYKVYPLGKLVSFSHPEPQIDSESRLHVLFQNGARSFSYCVVDTGGNLLRRERYDYDESRPRLISQTGGAVGVSGGIRRLTSTDFPSPSTLPISHDGPKADP